MKSYARYQSILIYWFVLVCKGDNDYQNKLTKLWSIANVSKSDSPRTAVVNVTSASLLIQPSNYASSQYVPIRSRDSKVSYDFKNYVFKPRAIPLNGNENQEQNEKNLYYSKDNTINNKHKSEVLLPGNYFTIAEEKSNRNASSNTYNPLNGSPFQPTTIPLIRGQGFYERSMDEDDEPIIERPEGFSEAVAARRSLSDIFGVEDEDEDYEGGDGDGEYEVEEDTDAQNLDSAASKHKNKIRKKAKKVRKLSKYMMPLLLAYKLKYFALIPLLIAGLVLLVGTTGMAGFFFALFAAVMGLQKGGY